MFNKNYIKKICTVSLKQMCTCLVISSIQLYFSEWRILGLDFNKPRFRRCNGPNPKYSPTMMSLHSLFLTCRHPRPKHKKNPSR